MRPAAKMMMVSRSRDNGYRQEEARPMEGRYEPENRRSRRTGRFLPKNEYRQEQRDTAQWYGGDDRYENAYDDRYRTDDGGDRMIGFDDGRMRRVPQTGYRYDGSTRMIGFHGGEFGEKYKSDLTYDHRNELIHTRSDMWPGHVQCGVATMDRARANEWVRRMRNADGTTGEHWTYDQTMQVMRQRGIELDPAEFYATMNMLWSDYGVVVQRFGADNLDFWTDLAVAFLDDPDANRNKLGAYYAVIAKK